MTDRATQPYRAFLIRWWQDEAEDPDEHHGWRFSLEEVGGQQPRLGFTSLQALATYLEADLCVSAGGPECDEGG